MRRQCSDDGFGSNARWFRVPLPCIIRTAIFAITKSSGLPNGLLYVTNIRRSKLGINRTFAPGATYICLKDRGRDYLSKYGGGISLTSPDNTDLPDERVGTSDATGNVALNGEMPL